MFGLDQFSFAAVWSPWMLLLTIATVALYLWVTGPGRRHFADSDPVPIIHKISFTAGAIILYTGLAGPLNLLGHLTFTAHMIAMAISYLAAPPLLLYGLPAWLLRPITRDRWFHVFNRRFLHPVFTALFFNMTFSIYHFPAIHDFVMTNYTVHTLYYLLLFIAAMMMWWPVVAPVPELARLTDLRKLGYIFLNGALLTPACALIIFAPEPLFATYNDAGVWARAVAYCIPGNATEIIAQFSGPEQFSIMDSRQDQQLGGVIMKLFQETMYGTMLYFIFMSWYRKEGGDDETEEEAVPAQLHQV